MTKTQKERREYVKNHGVKSLQRMHWLLALERRNVAKKYLKKKKENKR